MFSSFYLQAPGIAGHDVFYDSGSFCEIIQIFKKIYFLAKNSTLSFKL